MTDTKAKSWVIQGAMAHACLELGADFLPKTVPRVSHATYARLRDDGARLQAPSEEMQFGRIRSPIRGSALRVSANERARRHGCQGSVAVSSLRLVAGGYSLAPPPDSPRRLSRDHEPMSHQHPRLLWAKRRRQNTVTADGCLACSPQ